MTKFGQRLREVRQERGFTQQQLAALLQVNQITISTWERGTREPSIEMIKKIAKLLITDPNYLVGFDEMN